MIQVRLSLMEKEFWLTVRSALMPPAAMLVGRVLLAPPCKVKAGKPARSACDGVQVLEAELGVDLLDVVRALLLALVVVVARAELVHDRAREDPASNPRRRWRC